jgi:ABC-type antimicrobial peptide transport system permease subunit
VGAYAIIVGVFNMEWHLDMMVPLSVITISVLMIIIVGAGGIYKAMSLKPLQIMRG